MTEVLTAFIREHSHEQWPPSDHPASRGQEPSTRPDVQAALTVVGRRDPDRDIQWIDLTGADLAGGAVGLPLSQALVRSGIYALARRRPHAARQLSRSVNLGRAK